MRETRNSHRIFVVKPAGKKALGGPIRSWKNITADVREIHCELGKWMELLCSRLQRRTLVLHLPSLLP
jgi:hypothetical protein